MANQIKRIFLNMSWMMASQIITSVLAFIWTILIARYLGVSDYGIFGYALSMSMMFSILSDFGISTHIIRSVAVDNSIVSKYLGNAVPLKFILSILYIVVVFIILSISHQNVIVIYVTLLFCIECAIKNFVGLLSGLFQAYEKGKYPAIANTLLAVFTLIFILMVIVFNLGLNGITWAYIMSNTVSLLYIVYALRNFMTIPKFSFDRQFWIKLLNWGTPFAITGIFYTVYYSIDVVMIEQMVSDYATGIYNATYKLIDVLTLFYSIYTAVIFPIMSKQFKNQKSLLVASFEKSTKYLSMVTIPLAIGCLFYSKDIIHFIYGSQYGDASYVLDILIWTVCFLFINGAASNELNASHKEYSVTKIYIVAAFFNVALNLFLIPNYSYIGASIATVLSEILILFLELFTLRKLSLLPGKHLVFDIVKICFCCLIFGFILYILNLNIWVAIPFSIVVYLILLLVTKSFDSRDKYIIKQILGK